MKNRLTGLGAIALVAIVGLLVLGLVAVLLVALASQLTNPAVYGPLGSILVVLVAGLAWAKANGR